MGRRKATPAWRRQIFADARRVWGNPLVRVAVFTIAGTLWLAVWLIGGGWLPAVAGGAFGVAAGASYLEHREAARKTSSTTRRAKTRKTQRGGWKEAKPTQTRPARQKLGTRTCSAACQRSTKPANTCDCSCGGSTHGRMVAGSRANLKARNPKTDLHPRELKAKKARERAAKAKRAEK